MSVKSLIQNQTAIGHLLNVVNAINIYLAVPLGNIMTSNLLILFLVFTRPLMTTVLAYYIIQYTLVVTWIGNCTAILAYVSKRAALDLYGIRSLKPLVFHALNLFLYFCLPSSFLLFIIPSIHSSTSILSYTVF